MAEMLVCSNGLCNQGFHLHCLTPPLSKIPRGKWLCPDCRVPSRASGALPAAANPVVNQAATAAAAAGTSKPATRRLLPACFFPPPSASPSPGPGPSTDPFALQARTTPRTLSGYIASLRPTNPTTEAPLAAQRSATPDSDDEEPPTWELAEERENDIYDDELVLSYLRDEAAGRADDGAFHELSGVRRRVRKRAANYTYRDGSLWRTATARLPERIVPPPAERAAIARDMHRNFGHQGRAKVLSMLSSRFWWKGMSTDVAQVIATCAECKKQKVLFKEVPEMRPLPPKSIMHRVAVDTMGPFPKSRRGNRYIFVAQDPTSKWPQARATPDKSSATAARFLLEEVYAMHGAPAEIYTDQGTEYRGEVESLLKSMNTVHQISPAYHPQSNGQVERMVGTIQRALQRCVEDDPTDWDSYLHTILLGYRAAPQASTRFSPAMLLYGRELVLPAQLKARLPDPTDPDSDNEIGPFTQEPVLLDDELRAMGARTARQQELEQAATNNILTAQEKQKSDFQRRKNPSDPSVSMPPGSMVWLKKPPSSRKSKLEPEVEGPYQLVEWNQGRSKANLLDGDGRKWSVHAHLLAPYTL